MDPSVGLGVTSDLHAGGNPHVLTLTPFYPSEADDSFGCFVSEPLQGLAKIGVRNRVLAVQPFYRGRRRSGGSAVRGEWLRYFSMPGGFGLPTAGAFVFARIVPRLRMLHRSQPFDLIHAHGALPCGHTAMLLSRALNIPFVVSVHGLDAFSREQVKGRSGAWSVRISRLVYAASNRVICVSDHVRQEVIRGMDRPCRTSVVYNGVDPELFSPNPAEASSVLSILSVGNLIPIKGHEHLIRALALLATEFSSLQLRIIGDGPERCSLEKLAARLQVSEKVRFHGRESRATVAAAMRECTVFALPSRYEGLGCVYLEAMSCSKPVVGCQGQGISEIVQPGVGGYLVAPGDEKELTDVLRILLRDPDRRRALGEAGRATILNRLTIQHQSANLYRVYRECLQ